MRNKMLMEDEILELFVNLYREAARCELHGLRTVNDFCGYVFRDSSSEECPICTVPKTRFNQVTSR